MARRWLEQAIESNYLPAIRALEDTPEGHQAAAELCQRIRQFWHDRGSKVLTQQQGPMDQTRRAIKDALGADHWSLDYIKFSKAETVELNNLKQDRVAARNEATQQLENPDEIVATAVRLLESAEWADIAAGLAVLTGRRVAEILSTGHFEPKTQWSVVFTGAVKRKEKEQGLLAFEIPTLTTAHKVQNALSRVRFELPQAIEMSPGAINEKFEGAVANTCDRAFSGLVPPREGKERLYTHLFRAVYPTIATFWYCPPSVNETEFKAAIQGHYFILNEPNQELRRSLAAGRHYSDYEISDREVAHYKGKRKGIKLGVAGIEPIERFQEAWRKGMEPKAPRERKVRASYRIWQDDKVRLDRILEPFKEAGMQQQDRVRAFLDWFESQNLYPDQAEPQTEVTTTEAPLEDIPMHTQVGTSTGLDQPELDAPPASVPTTSPTIASATEDKIDRLIEVMTRFVEMQTAAAQPVQSARPARTARATRTQEIASMTNGATAPGAAEQSGEAGEGTEQPRTPQTRAGAEETANRINQAIDAIIAYNNAPNRKHDDQWAIGINTLKAFVKSQEAIVAVIGGRNRKGEQVQGTRQAEIEQHHHDNQIDSEKHNYRHRGKTKIQDVITLE